MPPTDVTAHIQTMHEIAHQAQHHELLPPTKTRLYSTLSYLTHSLRTLHSTPLHLPDFLHQTIPPLISVFTSSLHTYPLNKDVTHQTLLLLSSFYTTNLPKPAAILSTIPPCFDALASQARKQDVRPLLNALLLIASTSPPAPLPPSFCPLRPLFNSSSQLPSTHPLITMLHTLLAAWLTAPDSLRQWPTVYYLDVSEAVSVALTIKLDVTLSQSPRSDCFVSGVRTSLGELIAASDGAPLSLIQLAFSSGVLRALQISVSPAHREFRECISESLRVVLVRKSGLLKRLRERRLWTEFTKDDTEIVTMVFLTLRVLRAVVSLLEGEHVSMLAGIVRNLVSNVAECDASSGKQFSLFHRQLLWCIKSSSIMLGSAYAVLSHVTGADDVIFLRHLATQHPTDSTVTRFVSAATLKWTATPAVAVELIDVLSFLAHKASAVFKLCVPRLGSVACAQFEVTGSLAALLCAVLEDSRGREQHERILFLVDALHLCLAAEQTVAGEVLLSNEPVNACATRSDDHAGEGFWVIFVSRLQQSLEARLYDDPYCSKCIMCLSQILSSQHPDLRRAQSHLIAAFVPFLLKTYLLPTSPLHNKHILQVATLFDIVADRHTDHCTVQQFLSTILDIAKNVNDSKHRLLAVFLLRFLSRCDISLFDVVSESVSSFIGSDPGRKLSFLPLVRFAVLSMDMLRKNKSIAWLFTFFRDVSSVRQMSSNEAYRADLLAKI
eukprot:GFKZ01007691.1.p1 GENE.GFKZ01007691.1~~GFKZ01007691.1.p1  ORF type:complete len:738 (-),score=56.13 GFKZ01007691.1:377-2545(-)